MQKDYEILLGAATRVGGYRAIELIAVEGRRRLAVQEPDVRVVSGADLIRAFRSTVERHGDAIAAAFIRDALHIYMTALRDRGLDERSRLWAPVCEALAVVARKAK